MSNFRRRLDHLQRLMDARRAAEVDALGPPDAIPIRYYELDADGNRHYVDATPEELELEEKMRRLVHGPRTRQSGK